MEKPKGEGSEPPLAIKTGGGDKKKKKDGMEGKSGGGGGGQLKGGKGKVHSPYKGGRPGQNEMLPMGKDGFDMHQEDVNRVGVERRIAERIAGEKCITISSTPVLKARRRAQAAKAAVLWPRAAWTAPPLAAAAAAAATSLSLISSRSAAAISPHLERGSRAGPSQRAEAGGTLLSQSPLRRTRGWGNRTSRSQKTEKEEEEIRLKFLAFEL